MKACSRCKVEKQQTTEFFSPLKKAKDGLHSWCKTCLAEWRRADRARDKDRYSEIEKRRHQKHGEARRERSREAWAVNGHKYNQNSAPRRQVMASEYNAKRREKRSDPKLAEQVCRREKEWREKNAEKLAAYRKKAWKMASPQKKLRTYFGSAICHSLQGRKKGGKSWQTILGFTKEQLASHLERQFLKGMAWENYGQWHVDHIRPVASFKFESASDPEFFECWSLTNLRPMWASDNIRKRDKIVALI